MAINFPLPDGTYTQIPDDMPFEEADKLARAKFPDAYASRTQEKPREGFLENLKAGVRQGVSQTGLGIGSLINEQKARQAYRADKAAEEALGVRQVGLGDVEAAYEKEGLLGALQKVPAAVGDTIAQLLPQMGVSLAGASAGAAMGAPLGPIGSAIGAGLGGMAATIPMFYGSNLARQDEAAPNQAFNKTAAVAAAVPQAALDAASNLFVLGKALGITKLAGIPIQALAKTSPEVIQAKLVQEAQRSLLKTVGTGAAKGVVAEMPTEVAQQVLERAQAGLPLLDPEAVREYQESAFGAALAGGVLGGAAGPVERAHARGEVRRGEALKADAERATAIEEERKKKLAEEEQKKSPDYLVNLEKTYTDNLAQIAELDKQIRALGKVNPDSAEAVQKKDLIAQIKELKAAQKPVAEEYNSKKAAIAVAKEQARVAGMTPLQYQMEQAGVDLTKQPEQRVFTGEEETAAPQLSQAQQYAQQQVQLGQQLDNGTYQEKDYAELLLKNPELAAQVVAEKVRLPGFSKQQNDAILGLIKLNLKEQEKQAKTQRQAELEQANADLATQATAGTQATEPDVAARIQQEQEALRNEPRPAPTSPEYEKEDLAHLDNLFEQATNKEQPDTVKVPETIKPDATAASRLAKLNELFDLRDSADARVRQASLTGNIEARDAAVQDRERAATNINTTAQEKGEPGPIGEVLRRRQKQEETLNEIGSILEDLKYGITLDNVEGRARSAANKAGDVTEAERELIEEKTKADLQGLATGTTKTLNDKIKKLKQEYISAAIEEAAINRRLFGKTLTKQEALKAARDIRAAFDEWVTRTQALPRSAVEEWRAYTRRLKDDRWLMPVRKALYEEALRNALIKKLGNLRAESIKTGELHSTTELTPEERSEAFAEATKEFGRRVGELLPKAPVYEGTGPQRKIVDRGRRESIDPRDLEDRPLGAYEAATQVLKEQIKKATSNLTRVPEGTVSRVPGELLRPQYAQEEARKVAEQRGETAKTEAGRIRRLVEHTTNLVERALTTRGTIPPVHKALSRAKNALDAGNTSEKLMDAAGTLANRVLNGQKERTQNDALVREINEAIDIVEKAKVSDQTKQGELFGTEHLGFFRANAANFQKALDTSPEVKKAKQAIKDTLAAARNAVENQQTANKLADILRREKESDTLVADKAAVREAVLTPKLKEAIQQAKDKIDAANTWLFDLEKKLADLRKQAKEKYDAYKADTEKEAASQKFGQIFGKTLARDLAQSEETTKAKRDIRVIEYNRLNKQIEAVQKQIDAETARLKHGQTALDKIEERLQYRADRIYAGLVAQREGQALAASKKAEAPVQTNLQKLESRIQKATQTRLDLPGRIVEKGKVVEEVGSATNDAIDRAQEDRARVQQYAEELSSRKEALEVKKNRLLGMVQTLSENIDELRTLLTSEKNKKTQSDIKDAIAANVREINSLKAKAEGLHLMTKEDWTTLDEKKKIALRKHRERIESAKRTGKAAAPTTMRTGTEESKARTEAISERKVPKKKEIATLEQQNEAEDLSDIGVDFGKQDTLFRTGTETTEKLDGNTAKQVVDAFLEKAPKSLKNTIEFYPTQKDIPVKRIDALYRQGAIRDDGAIVKGGLLADGKILVIGDAHENVRDLEATLAHEITGHLGVRKVLGADGINRLAARIPNIEQVAKTLGLSDAIKQADADSALNKESARDNKARRVDELLAHMEEKVPSERALQKVWRFVQELIGAIKEQLRKFNFLDQRMQITPSDLHRILARARQAAMQEGEAAPSSTLFRTAKATHEDSAVGDAFTTMVGKPDNLNKFRENYLGLGFRTRFVDAYAGIKEALKSGDPTKAIQVTYDLMNFSNRSHFLQQSVTTGVPVRRGGYKVRGQDAHMTEIEEGANLSNVAKKLHDVKGFGNDQATHEAFTLYALAKRAKTEGWDRIFGDLTAPKNATPEQLANIEQENKQRAAARAKADALANDSEVNAKFKDAYDEYQAWNKGMLRFAMQSGVISDEEFRRLSAKGNYTPAFRADKHGNLLLELDSGRDITVGRLADESMLQQLRGGSGQVMDFFKASVMNASTLIDASLNNIASREAAFALKDMGLAHPVGKMEKGANIVEFRVKGEKDRQRFAVDTDAIGIPTDLVVKGFAGVPASLPGIVRFLGAPAQLLRKAVTRNPLYMARQLVRDPMSAWLVTGADMNPVTGTFKEVGKALSGLSDKTLDKRGITGGMLFAENETDVERLQKEAASAAPWSAGYWMAKLDHAALAADAVTRRNVYNGALKNGASEMEATLAAWESMPFSKRGTSPSIRMANHLIPFLSVTIQGWDTLYRAIRNDMPLADRVDVRNKLLARAGLIAALTMLYAAGMEDDEAYKNATDQERLMNWIIRDPVTNTPIKIPVPFELGIFSKMIPEAVYRSMASDKNFGEEMGKVLASSASMVPSALPQFATPIIEAMANHSFYSGAPIEGRQLEGLDIGKRSDYKTSELSKFLGFDVELFGKQYGVSPKMLEYMLGQYTAGIYPALAAIVDNVMPAPDTARPARTLAEMPVFRSAILQEDSGGEVSRLYDKVDQFTRSSKTFDKLVESSPLEAQKYLNENRERIKAGQVAESIKSTLDQFAAIENTIRNAPKMTADEKKAALDRVKAAKTAMARKMNVSLSSLGG